jgi:hypothetical protein
MASFLRKRTLTYLKGVILGNPEGAMDQEGGEHIDEDADIHDEDHLPVHDVLERVPPTSLARVCVYLLTVFKLKLL